MKIYFGQITGEHLESRVKDNIAMFMHEGRAYEYALDINSEYITITDTIGRTIPFDLSDIGSLCTALVPVIEIAHLTNEYNALCERIENTDIVCV
jgi:hypothetical protein